MGEDRVFQKATFLAIINSSMLSDYGLTAVIILLLLNLPYVFNQSALWISLY